MPKDAPKPPEKKFDSIFLISAEPEKEITMSIYNRQEEFFKKRPNTAPMAGQFDLLPGQKAPLKPVPEEGEEQYVEAKSSNLPDFKPTAHLVNRGATEALR